MGKALEKVRDFISRHRMLSGARGVLVAVSGGPDSVALLSILIELAPEFSQKAARDFIRVAHLDHMLRGPESKADAEFVRELARSYGLQVVMRSVDVAARARAARHGIEQMARHLRYSFFLEVAREAGCDRIAVGHTMNDQAETFLMRLLRGAGSRGLASMRPVATFGAPAEGAPLLIRPLLCLSRDQIEQYCRERGLSWRVDSSNLSQDYARNRVRHRLLPLLRELNPRAVQVIARAASNLASEDEALRELARRALDRARSELEDGSAYSVADFLNQPRAIRVRMIEEAVSLQRKEIALTAEHFEQVERLLCGEASGRRIKLPGGLEVWREFDLLVFRVSAEDAQYCARISADDSPVRAAGFEFELVRGISADQFGQLMEEARRRREERGRDWMMAVLDDMSLPDQLLIRPRRRGERAGSSKKLKSLMIDHKIPAGLRRTWPVVATPEGLYVWSPGLPPSPNFKASGWSARLAVMRAYSLDTARSDT
jgi:tRNA(Ile)-lysidine synthase